MSGPLTTRSTSSVTTGSRPNAAHRLTPDALHHVIDRFDDS